MWPTANRRHPLPTTTAARQQKHLSQSAPLHKAFNNECLCMCMCVYVCVCECVCGPPLIESTPANYQRGEATKTALAISYHCGLAADSPPAPPSVGKPYCGLVLRGSAVCTVLTRSRRKAQQPFSVVLFPARPLLAQSALSLQGLNCNEESPSPHLPQDHPTS